MLLESWRLHQRTQAILFSVRQQVTQHKRRLTTAELAHLVDCLVDPLVDPLVEMEMHHDT